MSRDHPNQSPEDDVNRVRQEHLDRITNQVRRIDFQPSNHPAGLNQHSSHWQWFLKSKGTDHPLAEMLAMRRPDSPVTRGFGHDGRFSPSYDYCRDEPLYQAILKIPESSFGDPEQIFSVPDGTLRSGNFLRNASYAYEIIRSLKRNRNDPLTILEIGPGFGMLAYILGRYLSNSALVLVDIPESLQISAWYLENTLPDRKVKYLKQGETFIPEPNTLAFASATTFSAGVARYDLVINCDSMAEMDAVVANNYLSIIENDIAPGGLFFFQNKEAVAPEAVPRPTAYPFSEHWTVESVDPVYVGFLDDYRHIQIVLSASESAQTDTALRNAVLDAGYRYFYAERLDGMLMFDVATRWNEAVVARGDTRDLLRRCMFSPGSSALSPAEQALLKRHVDERGIVGDFALVCLIRSADSLIDAGDGNAAIALIESISETTSEFPAIWAAGRLFGRLGDREGAARSFSHLHAIIHDMTSNLVLRAGKQLAAQRHNKQAAELLGYLCETSNAPSELLNALTHHPNLTRELAAVTLDRLPSQALATGYFIVRIARIWNETGDVERCADMLAPLVEGVIIAGPYELLMAAELLENDQLAYQRLLMAAADAGKHDNGVMRHLGRHHATRERYRDALEYLKTSLKIDAAWGSTHYDIANVYRSMGDSEAERAQLREVLKCGHNKEVDYSDVETRLRASS